MSPINNSPIPNQYPTHSTVCYGYDKKINRTTTIFLDEEKQKEQTKTTFKGKVEELVRKFFK